MNRYGVAAMLAVVCTACVPVTIKTSAVTPAGEGTYLVVGKPSYASDWRDIRIQTFQAATDYCAGQNQKMQAVKEKTHGTSRLGAQDLELTFRCRA